MTVGEIGKRMDAIELMEWVAYFKIQDDKGMKEIQDIISKEATVEQTTNQLRAFLSVIGKK